MQILAAKIFNFIKMKHKSTHTHTHKLESLRESLFESVECQKIFGGHAPSSSTGGVTPDGGTYSDQDGECDGIWRDDLFYKYIPPAQPGCGGVMYKPSLNLGIRIK